jgi:ureidoglycolate dehydrogenase (NAD+)
MAGHKGYGLALLAEFLSGVLPGGAMMWQVGSWIFDEPNKPSRHNAAFIVIDVATIAPPAEFAARMQEIIDLIHSQPTAAGVERVLLPGEREWKLKRAAELDGIALPEDVLAKLRSVSQEYDVQADW